MSVLFAMPNWSAASELWMQRMIEGLAPHIAVIAADYPTEPTWRGTIPTAATGDTMPSLWRRAAFGLSLASQAPPRRRGPAVMRRLVARPDVHAIFIHFLGYALQFEDVWAASDKPLFIHVHGVDTTWDLRTHVNPDTPMYGPDYPKAVRRLAQRATIIANSHANAQRLLDIGVPEARIVVKYIGVPVPPAPPAHSDARSGLHVLFLGRLLDCKGPDLVIRAFEIASARGFDGRLTIAGGGSLMTTCRLMQRRSAFADRITLTGAVSADEGQRLRDSADIFTAHSCTGPLSRQEEAFGVSFVEAMAAAIPVVSAHNGSLPEVVVEGQTGILVTPGDVEAHAQALLDLASDPARRRAMGEAGWRRARDLFSIEKEQRELRDILHLPA